MTGTVIAAASKLAAHLPFAGLVRSYRNPCPGGSTIATLQHLDALPGDQKPSTVHESVRVLVYEFCNDPDEWHALVYGFTTAFAGAEVQFDAENIPIYYPVDVKIAIRKEYHYFEFGRFVGKVVRGIIENKEKIGYGTLAALLIWFLNRFVGAVKL